MKHTVSAETAISAVQSGHRIYLHSVAAAPQVLIKELVRQAPRLRDVEIVHLHTEGEAPYADPSMAGQFPRELSVHWWETCGGPCRKVVQTTRSVFLSEIPALFPVESAGHRCCT